MEAASAALAKDAAQALGSVRKSGVGVLRRWLAPRLHLVGSALLEFGRGYRTGRDKPIAKIDVRKFLSGDDAENSGKKGHNAGGVKSKE